MSDNPRPAYVTFEVRAVEDRTASVETGHFASKDVVFAVITPAGTKDRIEKVAEEWLKGVEEGVNQERIPQTWLVAYQQAYKAFCESQTDPEFGTAVSSWPAVSPSQVKCLLDANIRSVEDLAEANEEALARIGMGARALKQKAQAWLDAAKDTGKTAAELASLRTENERLKVRDEEREKQLADLAKKVEVLEGASSKKG